MVEEIGQLTEEEEVDLREGIDFTPEERAALSACQKLMSTRYGLTEFSVPTGFRRALWQNQDALLFLFPEHKVYCLLPDSEWAGEFHVYTQYGLPFQSFRFENKAWFTDDKGNVQVNEAEPFFEITGPITSRLMY